MVEPGLETDEPVVDISIDTENAEEDEAVARLLATLGLERVATQTLQVVGVEQAVTLTLVIGGDTEIQALNRQYRQQDKPTDVLSFPLLDKPLVQAPAAWLWQMPDDQEQDEDGDEMERDESRPLFVTPDELGTNLGDIIISWPTVQRQASEAGHTVAYELLFLFCHGILHLVGYDDQTEAGYAEMVRLQKAILAELYQES